MKNNEIDEIVEQLSIEFVLMDLSDLDDLGAIKSYFKEIKKWADQKSFPVLSGKIADSLQNINAIVDDKCHDFEKYFDKINKTISQVQYVLKTSEDLQTQKKVVNDDELVSDASDASEKKAKDIQKDQIEMNASEKINVSNSCIRHPTALPSHIDNALFTDFLSLQMPIIDHMEAILIEIENSYDEKQIKNLKRMFHTLKGEAGFLNLDDMSRLCHSAEDIFDNKNPLDFIDIFLNIVDWLGKAIKGYSGLGDMPCSIDDIVNIADTADQNKSSSSDDYDKNLQKKNMLSDDAKGLLKKKTHKSSKKSDVISKKKVTKIKEIINVDAERLDRFVNIIGELVILESMVRQSEEIKGYASPEFIGRLNQLEKITRELQDMGLKLRMVPLKPIFNKMGRIIRDLTKKNGKKINFLISGEDTELDKTIVDKIGDPLLHIVRNAVDHGVENCPEEREAAGKPAVATIKLSAFHKGGNIYIEVADDGQGIDRNAVIKKAIGKGIIGDNEKLSDRQVYELIFRQGFSTATIVTDLSGRGVGMDVVKTSIESLKGQVEIKSKKRAGSVFIIRIPLTLAIIDGMIVKVKNERYIIPTMSIVTSIKYKPEDITSVLKKGETAMFKGHVTPLCRLSNFFHLENNGSNGSSSSDNILVFVTEDDLQAGLLVDEIIGKQQIVIKNLGESMKNICGVSGSAIMPDGRVSLILDVGSIMKSSFDQKK